MSRPQAKTPARSTSKSQTPSAKRSRLAYHSDIELSRAKKRAFHSERTPAEKLERTWRQLASPGTPRPGSANSRHPRKAAIANAKCTWSDGQECFRAYIAAAVMSELFGCTYVVDHTVPLTSSFVCGLHNHHNLRVIQATQNRAKSNAFWPGMWPIDWETYESLTGD